MDKPYSEKGYDFEPLSYRAIGVCIDVMRQLGVHCKEEDYQRAIALALSNSGIQFEREAPDPVLYDGQEITQRRVDFRIWDDKV